MRGFLSLGANLGDREAQLREAMSRLERHGVRITKASRIYETVPVEVPDRQRNYLNMVVEVAFQGDPTDLLNLSQKVEDELGRTRTYAHASRTIDIDILLLDEMRIDDERLKVPHPGLENRAFVIFPLAEIAPDLILPSGRTVIQVKKSLKNDEIMKIQDL